MDVYAVVRKLATGHILVNVPRRVHFWVVVRHWSIVVVSGRVGGGVGWGDKLNYSYVSKMFHTVEVILSFRNAICAITGNKWNDAIRTRNTQGSWLARVMKMEESRLTYNIKLKYKLLYSNLLLNEASCDTHSEPKVVVIYKTISPTTIRIKYTYDRQWSLPVIVK